MTEIQKVTILGTPYSIISQTDKENAKLQDANGLCEIYAKEIVLCDFEESKMTVKNVEELRKKVLRHEIIHAFMHESGLGENSDYARDEELVDWIAFQFSKMLKAFEETNCI